ncbi:MAG TPA: cation-efflux pump [Lachnospiraceae bacterium]|nr:cation-efflux pump [Lachnospiraceae bacterium]HBI72615.1 cation-efflux pump [Lachnospiraceae bacterium]HBY72350.1 cation-efflux pump [Lachnospiraceae bacterium]HCA70282.1 cation-efflux pump [Lachnospiraceae bacterium]HCM11808.1 cation-efflux pump [Lachnospiraceae bacterium]
MTDILVKLFVKNYDRTEDQKVRSAYGILSSVVGVICNIILFAIKLIAGLIINSISIMADAFNNLSDAASSIISFIGVKLAERPADKEHPFGHGRFEYIAALVVSFLILQVGLTLFKSSFKKVLKPEAVSFNPVLIAILCASILVKVWLMLFNRKLGNRINSTVMKATAADSMGDVLVTASTIISAIIAGVTGLKIDGYIGLAVSIFVMISGFQIAKDTLEPLLGQAVDRKIYRTISDMVESYEGIVGSHDLIIHSYGPTHRMATIHAEVPSDINFEKAHDTIDKIERDVLEKLDIFLVIHMDPIEVNNKTVVEKKDMVMGIIGELEPKASIHDFRLVNGEFHINLIFDLVIPFSYSKEQEQNLLKNIVEKVRQQDARYQCIITLENSYIAEK